MVAIGDSTSEGMISDAYVDPSEQLPAQLRRVGVQSVNLQISSARSIVETYEGQPNAYEVAQDLLSQGYRGCWVLAVGLNDAADVEAGSNVGMPERIQRIMSLIGNEPVMWVSVLTLLSSGYYAESGMMQWDQDLLQACSQYPEMRIFDWPSIAQAQPSWFFPDGIHYGSSGSLARATDIADALASAFPSTPQHSASAAKGRRSGTASDRSSSSHRRTSSTYRSTKSVAGFKMSTPSTMQCVVH